MSASRGAAALGSGAMFDGIASRYDVLNRVMSFGLDRRWRRRAARALSVREGDLVLDLATGTGDFAIEIQKAHPGTRVLGIDPSAGMLAIASRKASGADIAFRLGDATDLALEDAGVDGVAMAFGIRNVTDRPRALREMARVARAGARIVILELIEPEGSLLGALARAYVHRFLPFLGAIFSGRRAYAHLARSIAAFPSPAAFSRMLGEAGLEVLEIRPLTFGAACLFVARKV